MKVAVVCPSGYFRVSVVRTLDTNGFALQTTIYYPPSNVSEIDFLSSGTLQQLEQVTVGATILCMGGITLT